MNKLTSRIIEFKSAQPEPKSNMELFIQQRIDAIKAQELVEDFNRLLDYPNKEKISMRLDRDICEFYRSLGKGYQTAINAALRVVKDAIEAGKLSVNL